MKRRAAVAAAAALALAGCTVGPNYRRPAVPVPQNWRIPTAAGSAFANLPWWDVFRDPALQSLIRTALARNTDVRTAAANVLAAQAQVGIARAQQLPQVGASASAERERFSATGSFPLPPGLSNQFNYFTALGSVSYLVDFWGQYRRATEEARDSLLATEDARLSVIMTVVSDVAQGYFQLLMLDRELAITRETIASYQASLRLTEALYRYGTISELDVRQAQTTLRAAEAGVPLLEQQIAQEEDALSVLLGHNPEAIPRGAALDAQKLPPAVPAGLPSELLTRRPDVREAARNFAASTAAVGVAEAQLFPQIQLTGSGGSETTQLAKFATVPSLTFTALGGLTAPLYEGGQLRANVRMAKARRQAALIAYQAAALQAFREVNDALVAYGKTRRQVSAYQSEIAAAQSALNLANVRYSGGVDTYLTVLDSERILFSARLSLAQAQGASLAALVQLYQALGGGWQR